MKRLAAKVVVLVLLRFALLWCVITVFGRDPNNDTHIFILLAEKPILTHLVGDGSYSQYPTLLPVLFHALQFVLGENWVRISFILADALIFVLLSLRVAKFSGSYWESLYILGLFTAPATAIWAQDEIIAVLPLVALFALDLSVAHVLLIATAAFFVLKNFYIFLPVAVWDMGKFTPANLWRPEGRQNAYAIAAFAVMYLLDSSKNFVPKNAFTSSIWYFSDIDPLGQKYLSLGVFALFALFFAIFRYNACPWKLKALFIFSAFLNFFYHVNFEYFLFITLPALVFLFSGLIGLRTMVVITIWYLAALSTNVFYAAAYTVAKIEAYAKAFEVLHAASIVAAFAMGILSLALLVLEMRRHHGDSTRPSRHAPGPDRALSTGTSS
jgi:hypothetical protein